LRVVVNGEIDLSEAVTIFLRRYPGKNNEEFESRYGTAVDSVRDSVRKILEEAMRVEPDWSKLDLNGAGDFVEAVMHDRHPELSTKALIAIGNYYTYLMR
jgi:hypothetical protein